MSNITSIARLRKAVESENDRMKRRLLLSLLIGFLAGFVVASFTWMVFQNLLSLYLLTANCLGMMIALALIIRTQSRKWVLDKEGGC